VTDVLLIEDDPILRDQILVAFPGRFPDLRLLAAPSVEDGERALGSAIPRVVISDLWLPGKSGIDFVLQVSERWPKVGFVLMSARSPDQLARSASSTGVRYLAKPFELEELFVLVDDVLDGQAFSGTVEGITLLDLLQVLHLAGRTATVRVRRAAQEGTISLEHGEVAHAELGGLSGTAAFERMVTWPGGRFAVATDRGPHQKTIDIPFQPLVLETMQRYDEQNR
jgi:DNA-binding response OmpR family regulator